MIVDMPKKVWSRGRKECGVVTGAVRPCGMEGCTGIRIGVRWKNGKITYPCSKGMNWSPKGHVATII